MALSIHNKLSTRVFQRRFHGSIFRVVNNLLNRICMAEKLLCFDCFSIHPIFCRYVCHWLRDDCLIFSCWWVTLVNDLSCLYHSLNYMDDYYHNGLMFYRCRNGYFRFYDDDLCDVDYHCSDYVQIAFYCYNDYLIENK